MPHTCCPGVRVSAGLCVIGLLAVGCAGGGLDQSDAAPSSASSYQLPPRPVRPGETALRLPPTSEGDTEFTLLGRTELDAIQGSHAEFSPKGRFVRVRLVVVNTGRSGVHFDARRQQLVAADGLAHDVDPQAMLIKRQPGEFDLGANVRVEFDLYYDLPAGSRPVSLRVHGGPTLADLQDLESTDIPLG